ncbi:hypothetical protein [Psychroflexus sp. MBR-150]
MKTLILSMAFMLVTTFSFAGHSTFTNKINPVPENRTEISNQKAEALLKRSIHVTLSCGVEYDITNFTGTTTQLINSVIAMNNSVCGTNINVID